MQGQTVDDVEEIQGRLAKLARKPRVLSFISVTDGYSYVLRDDGGSIGRNGGFTPNAHRERISHLAEKKDKEGRHLFYAGERILSSDAVDATVSWRPAPIAPVWAGDPLASFQVIDAAAVTRIKANIELRNEQNVKANDAKASQVLDQLTAVANRVKQDAPRLRRQQKAASDG